LKAVRNDGLVATVSALAFISGGPGLWILRPGRHQAPPDHRKFAVRVDLADHGHRLCRRDVVSRRQFRLTEKLKDLGELPWDCAKIEAAAHG
jgi:hypothetical protein